MNESKFDEFVGLAIYFAGCAALLLLLPFRLYYNYKEKRKIKKILKMRRAAG